DAEGNTKASLQTRTDDVNEVTVPSVTDADNNGIKDSDEQAVADALAKVKAAEAAEKAAEDALADANADGIISQAEADKLTALNAKVAETKAAADAAVKALPEGAKDAEGNTKASLQTRTDDVNAVTVPALTLPANTGV
ncbi:GA-like domain-containing protein, partial [Neisseria oralis]